MKLPFLLQDTDWQSIKPRPSDSLGLRENLTDEQRTSLELFRTLDLRSEWGCKRAVENRNGLVYLALILILLNAANATNLLRAFLKIIGVNFP